MPHQGNSGTPQFSPSWKPKLPTRPKSVGPLKPSTPASTVKFRDQRANNRKIAIGS